MASRADLAIVITGQNAFAPVAASVNASLMSIARAGLAAGAGFLGLQTAASGVTAVMRGATDSIVGFNASLEQSRIAWATMLGGAAQANAMLGQLQQFAATTPFEFPEVERAGKRLLAMGFAAGSIIPILADVGNASAALGLGTEGIDRITLALGQMQARTKVSGNEMLQLTEAGIPAWRILSEAVGKSVADVQDAVTRGEISSDVFINAFRRFSQANYGGLMEKQSRTFSGALSTIRDQVRLTLAGAFEPLFEGLSKLLQGFAAFTSSAAFRDWATGLRDVQMAVGAFLSRVASSGPILDVLKASLLGIASVMAVQLVAATAQATAAMVRLTIAVAAANLPMALLAAAAAAAALVIIANWEQISDAAGKMTAFVSERLAELSDWLHGTFLPAANAAWESFANNAIGAFNTVVEVVAGLQPALAQVGDLARAVWSGFLDSARAAFRGVIDLWNASVGALIGKTVDADAVLQGLSETFEGVTGRVAGAASAIQRFVADVVPAAVGRTAALVQAAAGDIAQFVPALIADLQSRASEVISAFADVGKQAGTAFADSIGKPIAEELAHLRAQLAAGPANAALEEAQFMERRLRLKIQTDALAGRGVSGADVQALVALAMRRPGLELAALDAGRPVALAAAARERAEIVAQIAKLEQLVNVTVNVASNASPQEIARQTAAAVAAGLQQAQNQVGPPTPGPFLPGTRGATAGPY